MKYFSIHKIVGIEVAGNYKWKETLLINIPMFQCSVEEYNKTKTKITVRYTSTIHFENGYEVVPDIFINRNTEQIYDKKYGIQISAKKNQYDILCAQECNEWIMMLLEYALLSNHYTFIHSAGVEKNGKAYVFPSWGGVGKTASVEKLVRENGYKLLGDDLVILSEEGEVYAFPKKFVLYAYHKDLFPDVLQNKRMIGGAFSQMLSKFIPVIKSILRRIPGILAFARRHNPQSKRISPYLIFGKDKIAVHGKLNKFTWLERTNIVETKVIEIDNYTIASKAFMITIHELFEGRLSEFFIALCAGCFEYKILFDDSIKFICNAIKEAEVNQLFMPKDCKVEKVANDVVAYTKNEKY